MATKLQDGNTPCLAATPSEPRPTVLVLDVYKRQVLGAGLIFWSLMQALTGMVNSFSHFILMRIGLGIGEAPFMPAGCLLYTSF